MPRTGLEPACLSTHAPETCASTNSAPWAYTTERYRWSEKRDSNPRPQPWQGCTPPTEPLAHILSLFFFLPKKRSRFPLLRLSLSPMYPQNHILNPISTRSPLPLPVWSSPRPISDSQLHTLPYFHLCPIYLVLFKGSYCFRMGHLILRGASRLDAFSVYPGPTWLLCHRSDT